MIKLIIFDWDDVFTVGSTNGYIKCYHETLVELGVKLNYEEEKSRIFAQWSKPHREELKELLKENIHLLDEACRIYEEKLFGNAFIDCLAVIEGTVELLQRLKNNYILCIATGMNPRLLKEKIMPKFGFPQVFSQIVSSYDIEDPNKQKPDPYMVQHILEIQKIKPEEAVMVGDAETDVSMARASNIIPIVVLTGHLNRSEAEELNVKYTIENVTRLESVLKAIKS